MFDHLVIILCKELLLQFHVLHNGLNNKVGSLDGSVHCSVDVHVGQRAGERGNLTENTDKKSTTIITITENI